MNKYFKIGLVFLIGLATIIGVVLQSPLDNISKPIYQLKTTPTSLLFLSSALDEEIFKISPFDDYIYQGSNKTLVATTENFDEAKIIPNPLLFGQDKFRWKASTKTGVDIEYEINNQSENEILIKRKLTNKNGRVDSIGSSYVLCSTCLVTDQKKRFFLNQEFVEVGPISSAHSIGLIPTILSESLLPNDTTNITILDSSFNPKMSILIEPNTDVYYHQKWNIVELKNKGNISSQRISLY